MKYNLNLTRDYCSHWGIEQAYRELIANALDENGHITLEGKKSDDEDYPDELMLRLVTDKILPPEAFLMGYSVKDSENPIGQYGEGLKIAILILVRENVTFSLRAGSTKYIFSFETPEGFGVSTLHLSTVEDEENLSATDTEIRIFNVSSHVLQAVYRDLEPDSVVTDGGLYSQGLVVEPGFYIKVNGIKYGMNVSAPIQMNRDRNHFIDYTFLAPVLEQKFKPEDFLDMVIVSTGVSYSKVLSNISLEFGQKIFRAWAEKNSISKAKYENKIILTVENYGESTYNYISTDDYYVLKEARDLYPLIRNRHFSMDGEAYFVDDLLKKLRLHVAIDPYTSYSRPETKRSRRYDVATLILSELRYVETTNDILDVLLSATNLLVFDKTLVSNLVQKVYNAIELGQKQVYKQLKAELSRQVESRLSAEQYALVTRDEKADEEEEIVAKYEVEE